MGGGGGECSFAQTSTEYNYGLPENFFFNIKRGRDVVHKVWSGQAW